MAKGFCCTECGFQEYDHNKDPHIIQIMGMDPSKICGKYKPSAQELGERNRPISAYLNGGKKLYAVALPQTGRIELELR